MSKEKSASTTDGIAASVKQYLDALESNIKQAGRHLFLLDRLFLPPDSDAHIIHWHREGIFKVLERTTTVAALLALRRCCDVIRGR